MFHRLFTAEAQSRSARTIELYGWLILTEGAIIVLFPHFIAAILQLPTLMEQAANYFHLAEVLAAGIGMLYVMSGRLNAEGFVFASLLDRPLVPIIAALLWNLELIPGPLALIFSLEDFASFLWTLFTWRSERQCNHQIGEVIS
jgi:hypothetical protein